jgi:hypothetical protein
MRKYVSWKAPYSVCNTLVEAGAEGDNRATAPRLHQCNCPIELIIICLISPAQSLSATAGTDDLESLGTWLRRRLAVSAFGPLTP